MKRWVAYLTVATAVTIASAAVAQPIHWKGLDWEPGGKGTVHKTDAESGEVLKLGLPSAQGDFTSASATIEPSETWGVTTQYAGANRAKMRFLVNGMDSSGMQALVWVIFMPGMPNDGFDVWWYSRATGIGHLKTGVGSGMQGSLRIAPVGDRVSVLANGLPLVEGANIELEMVQGVMWNVTSLGAPAGSTATIVDVDLGLEPPAIPVEVLVRPGGDESPLNPKAKGHLPVAVLGSPEADMQTVDCSTISLGEAAPTHATFADVNEDGIQDLLLHFLVQEIGLADDVSGRITLVLEGYTTDGLMIRGSDTVRIVGQGQGRGNGRGN